MERSELLADPDAANAAIAAVLSGDKEPPVIPYPPSDRAELPGGLVHRGEVFRSVQVQELDGYAEEALARAIQITPGTAEVNWATFLQVLLEYGVEKFDGLDESLTKELLKDLMLGDRDALILAIRATTYGDMIEVRNWQCPHPECRKTVDLLELSLTEDVDVVRMDDPLKDSQFDVKLRKGRIAVVRLATGRDLTAMYERSGLNVAERESIQLSRCLISIREVDGQEVRVQGRAGGVAMELSIADRKTIIRALEEHQPGPRYNQIKFTHQDCQKEVTLAVGLGDLFPDLF